VRDIYDNTYDSREDIYDLCVVSFLSEHRVKNAKKYLKLKRNWEKMSEWGQYSRVAETLGAESCKAPALNVSDRHFNLQPSSIVIHAGCTRREYWARKKWTHYAELVELLVRAQFHMYCCGSADELIDHPAVTAYNNLPIQETAALIQQCDLFVSNDSGLMHLAAALRKRQIAIFTATCDKKSGPYYNPSARVIKPRLSCYPCNGNETVWNECVSWQCRDSITVNEVYEHITDAMHQAHSNAVSATS
jgi:ADP-heptose:LPS heptosyltransferase